VLGAGGTQNGRYIRLNGKTILVRGVVTLGTSPTMGTTQTILLPTAANATIGPQTLQLTFYNGTSFFKGLGVISANASLISVFGIGTNGVQTSVTSLVPFTWAAGNTIIFEGMYEAA
jgi:hypothetical protein